MKRNISRAAAQAELHRRGYPVFAGGAPGSTPWPLGPPVVNPDGSVTVEQMLQQPTRITRMIRDLTLERFLLDRLFTSSGGVSGGAVVYDMPMENDLYTERDIQKVAPGADFPILTSEQLVPKTAQVEKWGGKTFITDEARDRNNTAKFTEEIRKISNTIIRKLNQRAVEAIEEVFTDYPGQVIPGNDWTTVTTQGTSPTPYADQPVGDFVNVGLHNDTFELGMEHDLLLMHPQERARLQLIYGQEWQAALSSYGYTSHYVSSRVTAGTAYSIASGNVGQLRIESPLGSESWRTPEREVTWVQTSVRPIMFVTNPLAVVKLTGLAG